jgi:hypothetical protein
MTYSSLKTNLIHGQAIKEDNNTLQQAIKKDMGTIQQAIKEDNDTLLRAIKNDNDNLQEQLKQENEKQFQKFKEEFKKEIQQQVQEMGTQIKAQIHNFKVQQKNSATYLEYSAKPTDDNLALIYPLVKAVPGQMNVVSIKSENDTYDPPDQLACDPTVGSRYPLMPSTWNSFFKTTHHEILRMCQWHNDDMGITKSQKLVVQRQLAVMTWLTGRCVEDVTHDDMAGPGDD